MKPKTRVLFVCLGNIVRSPLAEHMFRQRVAQAGLDAFYHTESAGTANYHVGEPPDPRMQRVAARRGLVYTGQGRQFQRSDFERFDIILAMDTENRAALLRQARSEEDRLKVRLMRDFDPEAAANASVPDPYYDNIRGFEEVFEIIDRSCQSLLQTLESERISQAE